MAADKPLKTYALVGNQNCGKSTLFNRLTGGKQHVGNFPGVTVEQKTGKFKDNKNIIIVDLPGVYSLHTLSDEETITKNFLESKSYNLIINVIDATNLKRSLLLTLQLKELNKPMVVVLNMMDEVQNNNGSIDTKSLSKFLKMSVYPVSASKNEGIKDLIKSLIDADFSIPPRLIYTQEYIENVCTRVVHMPNESKEYLLSKKADKILTHKYFGIPIFLMIILTTFYITFNISAKYFGNIFETGIESIIKTVEFLLIKFDVSPLLYSLMVNGILKGVGAVLCFLPTLLTLFFLLSILEDSGYMARIAYIMDKPLRKFGITGKSVVPILIGFGCSVPAIMATRTMHSKRERVTTILLIPFISCSAKIPVYSFFAYTFFDKYSVLIIFLLYLIGIIIGLLVTYIINKGKTSTFIIELPNYRLPSIKTIINLMCDKAFEFVKKTFTVILLSTVVVWFLQTFNQRLLVCHDISDSILASISKQILPVFNIIGLDDWRMSASLLFGITAKESILSALNSLCSANIAEIFTPISAFCFLIFTMLYTPCFATVSAIKNEVKSIKVTILIALSQCIIAWLVTFIVYSVLS